MDGWRVIPLPSPTHLALQNHTEKNTASDHYTHFDVEPLNIVADIYFVPSHILYEGIVSCCFQKMGNILGEPQNNPVNVHLVHLHPQHRPIDGYVEDNQYTLKYTLPAGHNTVAQLLSMTQQHGNPTGNGIIGFTRVAYEWRSGASTKPDLLSLDETLRNGEKIYLFVI